MNEKEKNYLKTVQFETPDYIPMNFWVNPACFHHYNQDELFDLMEEHKFLFPDFKRPKTPYVPEYGNCEKADKPFKDDFGCVWTTTDNGITGTVTKHPLENWEAFDEWKNNAPDPSNCMGIGTIDWKQTEKSIRETNKKGGFTSAGLRHGHTFLQLCDLRGYENVLFDMIDETPEFSELLDIVESFNLYIVKQYTSFGVQQMGYAEDLGMQIGPMLPKDLFVKYIKPVHTRLMKPARDSGCIIHMHSDGDIKELSDELVDSGVNILNLQDLVNGIDWIKEKYAGKICIDLDIDRQKITRFGTPEEIDALIKEEVQKLGSKQGGLMMIYGLYPGVPVENVKALMDAMEKYAFFYN